MTLGPMAASVPAPGPGTTPAGAHESIASTIQANSFGAAVSYGLSTIGTSDKITTTFWNDLISKATQEANRRGGSTSVFSLNTKVSKEDFNNVCARFNVGDTRTDETYQDGGGAGGTLNKDTWGPTGAPAVPSDVTAGTKISVSVVNDLINKINASGAVCTCNCNYCTCNCNYCTCNCNYSCTCNCNYSDERLKENITLIDTEGDLNVYSYTYLWNKTKTYIGVMAQELLGTKYESALSKDINGFYYVDYSQLPVEFREA